MLTGRVYTDYSYASGTGAYNLLKNSLEDRYLAAAGIPKFIFPEIVPSHTIIGQVTKWAAKETGLAEGTPVACGGVDNACMALGAVGPEEGRIYTSLGSSSWIPVNSARPVLDPVKKPYVFAHICEGMYTSAFSIFAGGSSLRWVRETICRDISEESSAYRIMDEMAERVPVGSNGLIFNPSLAGGTSQDKSVNIQGAFLGLHLGSTREDMIRAAMEGIALNLKMSYECLRQHTRISAPILFCGGGSKSKVWMQMFADVFNVEIIKTNIDQDAASLGAAAIAAKAVGWWKDYRQIRNLHHIENRSVPNPQNVEKYQRLFPIFEHATGVLADFGDFMEANLLQ
jgi:xylulokinase